MAGTTASGRQISRAAATAARRRLSEGKSLRGVARELNLSVRTVSRIKTGTHVSDREERIYCRCPDCGGLVVLPCLECQVAADKKAARRAA